MGPLRETPHRKAQLAASSLYVTALECAWVARRTLAVRRLSIAAPRLSVWTQRVLTIDAMEQSAMSTVEVRARHVPQAKRALTASTARRRCAVKSMEEWSASVPAVVIPFSQAARCATTEIRLMEMAVTPIAPFPRAAMALQQASKCVMTLIQSMVMGVTPIALLLRAAMASSLPVKRAMTGIWPAGMVVIPIAPSASAAMVSLGAQRLVMMEIL